MNQSVPLLLAATLALLPASPLAGEAAQAEEARDAARREQHELRERTEALAQQLEDARRLQATQDAYLARLEAELARLRQQAPDQPRPERAQ